MAPSPTTINAVDLFALAAKAKLNARGKTIALLDGRTLGVSRFSRHPRWEIHPHGDEFLQVLEGTLDLTLLLARRRAHALLTKGSAIVVPKGVWHAPIPNGPVVLLHLADYRETEVSEKDDPREQNC